MRFHFVMRHVAAAALLAAGASAVHATNGMDMEGYGPIATGLGGAATAYDVGTSAMANNPATLNMGGDGKRADIAIGVLGPKVNSMGAESSATSFLMPAFGWTKTQSGLSYGFGMFAQGGMGVDFAATSPVAMGSGDNVRSELGVGRLIFPVAYQVNDKFTVGGSVDFVWAGLDLKMAAQGSQLAGMATGGSGNIYAAAPALGGKPWVRIDFSNNNDFTGAARGTGFGAKLGMAYALSPALRVGVSHHFKTNLSDLKTGGSDTKMSATGFSDSGQMVVNNFQWPATTTVGMSWQASDQLMVVADYKHIGWADVMKNFNMTYNSAVMGGSVSFALPQNWKNQNVIMVGASYKANEKWTLRGGVNLASNPVPAANLHPLFPAIVKNNYTLGAGYAVDKDSDINASLSVAPKVTVTNSSGTFTHSQTNFQIMYSRRY